MRYDIILQVKDDEGKILFVTRTVDYDEEILMKGRQFITCHIPGNFFNSGIFYINFLLIENRRNIIFSEPDILRLLLIDSPRSLGVITGRTLGSLKPSFNWKASSDS